MFYSAQLSQIIFQKIGAMYIFFIYKKLNIENDPTEVEMFVFDIISIVYINLALNI